MPVVEPFRIAVSPEDIDDLRQRLKRTRWPEKELVSDWSQGAPLARLQELCAYWADGYDWRRFEAVLNDYEQYRTEIDGIPIHFLHVRSPNPDAMPMLLTHGWPGSVVEFLKVVGPLSDPASHGGDPADAFHLVIPSLPGFGFSGKPAETGWGIRRVAEAWALLMERLGYDRYVAQGGDWGAAITTVFAEDAPSGLVAIHVNMPLSLPDTDAIADWTPQEKEAAATTQRWLTEGSGYSRQQSTRPQTVGYGLTDSPAGQAAWIYEKFQAWSDCDGDVESLLTRDELLDNISIYWFTGTAASSARLYWESMEGVFVPRTITVPTGCSIFPKEILGYSKRWVEKTYVNLIHWNELDRGGHFAAFEQPAIFVEEVRNCFRPFQRQAL